MMEVVAENEIIEQVQENTKYDDVVYTEITEPYGYIYITTNLINGKRYIGQKSFSMRDWKTYLGSGNLFRKALKKYGENNFVKNIISICYSEKELNQAEYELSVYFNVVESPDWYNLVLGGGGNRGWHPSVKSRKKMSDAKKGKVASQETKMKMSELRRGEKNYFYGKHHTEESKKKQSLLMRGRYSGINNPMYDIHRTGIDSTHFKPIFCIEMNRIFWGAKEVESVYGIMHQNIAHCLKGKSRYAGKHPETGIPLHWLYVYDQIEKNRSVIQGAISLGYITAEQVNNYLNKLIQKGNDEYGIMEEE